MSYTYSSLPPEKVLGINEKNPITAPSNSQVPVYNSTSQTVDWGTVSSSTPTDLNITGQTAGDILYFNGTNWIRLAKPASGTKYLQGGTTPSYTAITDLVISGQTIGNVLYFDGTNWVRLANGTSGQVLQSNGASAPSWVTTASGGADPSTLVLAYSTTIGNYTTPTSVTVSSTGTGTPVVEPFTTGWTQTGTKIVVTGGQGVATNLLDNETDYIYKSFSSLSNSLFSIDFDFQINSRTLNNGSLFGLIAFSATNTNCCTTANSNDMIGVGIVHNPSNTVLSIMTKDGTGSVITTDGTVAINLGTAYYGTLERLSTTTTRLRFWTSSTRLSGLVDTINGTVNSTTTGLSFAQVNSGQNGGGGGGITFSVDNLSTTPSLSSGNLFDNDTSTRWTSTSEINPNCYVDMGSTNLSAITLYADTTNTTSTQIKIQGSTDASSWTDLRTINVSALTDLSYNYIRFNVGLYRYIRVYGTDAGAKVLSIWEIKVQKSTDAVLLLSHGHLSISSSSTSISLGGT